MSLNIVTATVDRRPERVIESYTGLRAGIRSMLARADAGEWDALVDEQQDYVVQVDDLIALEAHVELDPSRQQAKQALLAEIHEIEQALAARLEDRMKRLSELMVQSRNEHRVKQAYDVGLPG